MSVFSPACCLISCEKLANLTRLTGDISCNSIININLSGGLTPDYVLASTKIINDVVQTGFEAGRRSDTVATTMFSRQLFARQEPVPQSRSLPYRILLFQSNAGLSTNVYIGNCSILHQFGIYFLAIP